MASEAASDVTLETSSIVTSSVTSSSTIVTSLMQIWTSMDGVAGVEAEPGRASRGNGEESILEEEEDGHWITDEDNQL